MTGEDVSLLDVKKLAYLLVDGYWQVSVVDEIDSTQTYLKSKKPFHGEVIAAEFQSSGRGRLDRTFEANKSQSLLFSFYVEPTRDRSEWGWLPLLMGIALEKVLNREKSIFYTKWPNDLLAVESARDGKVAGILTETHEKGVIIGTGINFSMSEHELPVPTATSLSLLGINNLDRNYYLANILKEFSHIFSQWENNVDFSAVYIDHSYTLGKQVKIQGTQEKAQEGIATEIGAKGELILEDGRQIYSGDVVHLFT